MRPDLRGEIEAKKFRGTEWGRRVPFGQTTRREQNLLTQALFKDELVRIKRLAMHLDHVMQVRTGG